ncbi:MAG: hypothetical protein ACRDSJ_06370 [Rubrobacteraceae bacterium]
MSRARLLPYRTIAASDVNWGGWWLERDATREPLPDLLPAWDYASKDLIGLSIEVQNTTVVERTGLDRIGLIEVVAVADCPAMLRRFITRKRLTTNEVQELELSIELPPGEIAQKLELSTFILLAEDIPASGRTASRRGSRLCVGPTRSVMLEGDASRFPTEAVSFSALHLANAPWTINAVFDDMSDSFMGSIRLLVNEDNELGRAVLLPVVEPQVEARLKLEVLRSLIALASANGGSDGEEYPAGSISDVVDSMCKLFLNRSLPEAIEAYERSPLKFDRLLHAGVSA